jgi:hypothetical protein
MKVSGRKIYNTAKGSRSMATEISTVVSLCVEPNSEKANINFQMGKYIKVHSTMVSAMVTDC